MKPNLIERECKHHGVTTYTLEKRGAYRCKKCRIDAVGNRRRQNKATIVREKGGCCQVCGYARCVAALQLHHVDPSTKIFGISSQGQTRSLERLREEADKCILLCANCHAEFEAGLITMEHNVMATSGAVNSVI